ncbi:MAG TPA: EVE domain-containing protein, partial [Devosia sp.]|nr:EVE domain-containing protein [Devosia sp.]
AVRPFKVPVSLEQIKQEPELADMVLVKNSRLSVQPVTEAEWVHICKMGGIDP